MDNQIFLNWLIYRYPHLSEYSENFCISLIRQAKNNTRLLRALIGVMFVLTSTLFLFLAASQCEMQILTGYQGLTLALIVCTIIQQVTNPLCSYVIKNELSAMIVRQKV
ncbi:hypothetical protein [Catenovulum agarivorans]|uniref:hypothetical protein n=1 Tax=Catenovulum agarivorans TaxID=1172192 RepID=UPI0003626037|nr:hypothetical protein [Catenovulum agarivorans]